MTCGGFEISCSFRKPKAADSIPPGSSNLVPLKTRRVGERCTKNLFRAQTSSRWCGVVARRGGCQLRCRLCYLTMVQNYELRRQRPSNRCSVRR
ncbi:uncharacterized protein TNCV_3404501 [Trichonephila clavipes]|nr:uncharacterized protein TNCV_3404501 [Trichonephila clavipes]